MHFRRLGLFRRMRDPGSNLRVCNILLNLLKKYPIFGHFLECAMTMANAGAVNAALIGIPSKDFCLPDAMCLLNCAKDLATLWDSVMELAWAIAGSVILFRFSHCIFCNIFFPHFRVANALSNASVPSNSPFALPKAPAAWIANVAAWDPENAMDGTAYANPRLNKLQNAFQYL